MIKGKEKPMIVYTGGGTAGHIFPGLAVAAEVRRKTGDAFRHCWIGSRGGMDRRLVEEAGMTFYSIPAGKLRRYISLKNFLDIFNVAAGVLVSLVRLIRLRPVLVFSKGGYVTVPVVLAAKVLGIPSISHESDAEPGLATRINSRFSVRILVSFRETVERFPPEARKRVEVSGNPVRPEMLSGNRERGREASGPGPDPVVLVLGGSQGSRQINTLVAGCLEDLQDLCRIVHQHGSWDEPPKAAPGYLPRDFIGTELPDFMAAADLVVCRAGASTLWEVAAAGKPSILIPLGTGSSRGDQIANAEIFRKRGASVVLDGSIDSSCLEREIRTLLEDQERLSAMGAAARGIAGNDGRVYISDIIQEEVLRYGGVGNN